MSTLGVWGYWGIVGGLVAMVCVLFICVAFLDQPLRGAATKETTSAGDQPDEAAAGNKHAA